jgi:hypothetical protein
LLVLQRWVILWIFGRCFKEKVISRILEPLRCNSGSGKLLFDIIVSIWTSSHH